MFNIGDFLELNAFFGIPHPEAVEIHEQCHSDMSYNSLTFGDASAQFLDGEIVKNSLHMLMIIRERNRTKGKGTF